MSLAFRVGIAVVARVGVWRRFVGGRCGAAVRVGGCRWVSVGVGGCRCVAVRVDAEPAGEVAVCVGGFGSGLLQGGVRIFRIFRK